MTASIFRSAIFWATGVSFAAHLALGAALMADRVDDRGQGPVTEPAVIQLELVSWARSPGSTEAVSKPIVASEPTTSSLESSGRQGTGEVDPSMPTTIGESGSVQAGAAAAAASPADVSAFQQRLLAHITRHRFYPEDRGTARPTGVVMVQFLIGADGAVSEVWVYGSSGDARLDRAAVATVRRAQPMPRPPAGMSDPLKVLLPIDFTDLSGATAVGGP